MLDLVIARLRAREREREIEAELRNRELRRALKHREQTQYDVPDDLEGRALINAVLANRAR